MGKVKVYKEWEKKIPSNIIKNYKYVADKYANLKWYDYLDNVTTEDRRLLKLISKPALFYHFTFLHRNRAANHGC
jgi:hypothetical protein